MPKDALELFLELVDDLDATVLLENKLAQAYARKDPQLAHEIEFELEELAEIGGTAWWKTSGRNCVG